jgi:hypothetical protein
MPAAQANILIEAGANFNIALQLLDNNGANINLSGYLCKFQVRGHVGDPLPVLSLDNSSLGGINLGGPAGTISIAATATQTRAIDVTLLDPSLLPLIVALDAGGNPVSKTGYRAPYSIEITDSNWLSGNVTRVLEGFAVITPEVCL